MLKTLNVFKARNWIGQLDPHRSMLGPPVKEKKISRQAKRNICCQNCIWILTSTINNYLPLRELSTAFSMNSIIVCDLNLAQEPNENVPISVL